MMLKNIYSIFRFAFEILCLLISGYWGFSLHAPGWLRFVAGIGLPLVIAIFWGVWMAPLSQYRLQGIVRLFLETLLYAGLAVCLYNTPRRDYTLVFGITALANALINYFTGWLV